MLYLMVMSNQKLRNCGRIQSYLLFYSLFYCISFSVIVKASPFELQQCIVSLDEIKLLNAPPEDFKPVRIPEKVVVTSGQHLDRIYDSGAYRWPGEIFSTGRNAEVDDLKRLDQHRPFNFLIDMSGLTLWEYRVPDLSVDPGIVNSKYFVGHMSLFHKMQEVLGREPVIVGSGDGIKMAGKIFITNRSGSFRSGETNLAESVNQLKKYGLGYYGEPIQSVALSQGYFLYREPTHSSAYEDANATLIVGKDSDLRKLTDDIWGLKESLMPRYLDEGFNLDLKIIRNSIYKEMKTVSDLFARARLSGLAKFVGHFSNPSAPWIAIKIVDQDYGPSWNFDSLSKELLKRLEAAEHAADQR